MTTDRWLAAIAIAAAVLPPPAAAAPEPGSAARAITLDGGFTDWRGVAPAASDPAGDGRAGGPDLGRLWLADDGEALYIRFAAGAETILQNRLAEPAGNHLRLLVDADASAATGGPVEGLGVEIEVRFGERSVMIYEADGTARTLPGGRGGAVALPTHSAGQFEARVPLPGSGATGLRLVLFEEAQGGDRLPDSGSVAYELSGEEVAPPRPIPLPRKRPGHLRLLSVNVEDSRIVTRRALYRRLLEALRPDLVVLQSLRDWDEIQTREFVASVLGGDWWGARVEDCVTVGRFPILARAPVDGNLLVHLDLPDDRFRRDLVLFNVHLPCCGNETERDGEADRLAATWRDLLAGAGPFPIGARDPVIFAGDFNFVGFVRQLRAIRDGVFIDRSLAPDFAPGRARGSLATAPLRHTHLRTTVTWRRATSPFAPGRLDWVFFSADTLRLARGYVLDTATMTRRDRRAHGLRKRDSERLSDHLALVADFKPRG